MTTAIGAVAPRTPTQVEGEVVSVTAHRTPPTYLDVILSDGTGTITLLFQGRTAIPGVCEGSHLRVAGTPWMMSELLLMLNPLYEFGD
jgi:DNA/RNA endonuclease YhcR with UshA esterase domain